MKKKNSEEIVKTKKNERQSGSVYDHKMVVRSANECQELRSQQSRRRWRWVEIR